MILTAVLIPIVLLAAGAGGLLLRNGGSEPTPGSVTEDLSRRAELPALPFPDPDKLGFTIAAAHGDEDAATTMCETIGKAMRTRGYVLSGTELSNAGAYCNFSTPGIFTLQDGSNWVHARVGIWYGTSVERLAVRLESARKDIRSAKQSGATSSGPVKFPAGEEGFIYYLRRASKGGTPRGDTKAAFRSGEYLMYVEVSGHVERAGDKAQEEPLEQAAVYDETAGIVQTLHGESEPIEPLIDDTGLKSHPELAGLQLPDVPEVKGKQPDEVCAAIAPALEQLGTELERAEMDDGPVSDDYVCASPSTLDQDASPIAISVHMMIQHYRPGANSSPTDEMGRDVTFAMRESGSVFGLPFTPFGYVHYEGSGSSAELEGGYVSGDDYITFEFSAYRVEDGRRAALTEKEMLSNLASYLKAIG